MNRRILVLLTMLVVSCVLVCPTMAMQWWEEEQSGVVQRTQGVDPGGVAYEVTTNWEDGFVQVEAIGTADIQKAVNSAQAKVMAEDAARVRAYAQLAEAVSGFNISSDITVENGLVGRSVQRMQLSTFLKGAKVVGSETVWLPDGTPLSTVKVGILLARAHPGIGGPAPVPSERPASLAEVIRPVVQGVEQQVESETPLRPFVAPEPPALTTRYTGLIIDARGLDATPSLAPKIFTQDGSAVWTFANADPDYAVLYGVVDWMHDMATARSRPRVGETPMVISARRVVGPKPDTLFKSDFIISDQDAAFLLEANKATHFLEKCAVAIIT